MAKRKRRIVALWRNIDGFNEQIVIENVASMFSFREPTNTCLAFLREHGVTHVDWQDDGVGASMPGGLKCGIHPIHEVVSFLKRRR